VQTTTAPSTKVTTTKPKSKMSSFIVPDDPDVLVPHSEDEPSAEGYIKGSKNYRKYSLNVFQGPRITKEPESIRSKWNKSVHLVCKVKGDPEPEIYWIRNDKQISSKRFKL
jgi:hypothetical protein